MTTLFLFLPVPKAPRKIEIKKSTRRRQFQIGNLTKSFFQIISCTFMLSSFSQASLKNFKKESDVFGIINPANYLGLTFFKVLNSQLKTPTIILIELFFG